MLKALFLGLSKCPPAKGNEIDAVFDSAVEYLFALYRLRRALSIAMDIDTGERRRRDD